MAQSAHGSAPDIGDLHIANPVAEILSGKLLLEWLARRGSSTRLSAAARDVDAAVQATLQEGLTVTPDLGGSATTQEMTAAILRALNGAAPANRRNVPEARLGQPRNHQHIAKGTPTP